MLSTRRQKAKARKSREMALLSDLESMDVILAVGNSNPLERELATTNCGSASRNDTEASFNKMRNSSQESEIRDYNTENVIPRMDLFADSMETFSKGINMSLSQEIDSLMTVMHSQINRAISSAVSDRVIPEIQNIMGTLSSGHQDTESGSSNNNQVGNEAKSGF